MQHPETKKMLQDIREGDITGLIFSKLARLARNTRELLDFADIFRAEDADLISLHESIDTSTPAGRLFYTMIAAMAQWEREEISERVAASVPIRAKLGKPLGGQASYGYSWLKTDLGNDTFTTKLVIDEKEAPIRKLIYELFLQHKRRKTTANLLNEMGYRTRNNSMFSDTTVSRLLRDPSAKGQRRANYTKSLGEGKNWVIKPSSEWVIAECPAIISEDVWNECNRILDEQENKRKRPGPRPVYLLSGFVHCTCGKKMYVFHNSAVYTCKACKNRIPAQDIDEIYHEQLKSFLMTDTDVSTYLKQSDTLIKEKESLLKVITDEANGLRKKMEELVSMRLNGELNRDSFPIHYKPLEERLGQIDHQIPELQGEVDFMKIQYLSSDTVLQEAKDLYSRWLQLHFDEKRTIIEVITDKITVGKEDIAINLSYLPSSIPNPGNSQRNFTDS
jgi:site-specific DNA recombinase